MEERYVTRERKYAATEGEYAAMEGRYAAMEGRYAVREGRHMAKKVGYAVAKDAAIEGRYVAVEGRYIAVEGRYIAVEGRYAALRRAIIENSESYKEKDPLSDIFSNIQFIRGYKNIKFRESQTGSFSNVILSPDFTSLAEPKALNSIPETYKSFIINGLISLVQDENKIPALQQLSNIFGRGPGLPTLFRRILLMGIRDLHSLNLHTPYNALQNNTVLENERMRYYNQALRFWKRKDRERGIYYLGCALKVYCDILMIRPFRKLADKNMSHLNEEVSRKLATFLVCFFRSAKLFSSSK